MAARPLRWAAGSVLAVTMVLAGCSAGPNVHDDPDGPLSATSAAGSSVMRAQAGPWFGTFGSYVLCVHDPGVNLELRGVGWRAADDAQPMEVRTPLRVVDRTTPATTPIGAVRGTPGNSSGWKQFPGRYDDRIAGRRVTQLCKDPDRRREFTELLFVLKVAERGADIPEAWIDYTADGEDYRLMIRWRMIGCGSAIEARRDETGTSCREWRTTPEGDSVP